ncbi:MAG: hypothetical protein M3Z85_20540 [Acidobacteriota bacterium]|nr:hypothetical protein [Acidobacteriota bacterium]
MGIRIQQFMRYWGFLAAKLLAGSVLLAVGLWFLNLFWTPPTPFLHVSMYHFGYDLLYTSLVGLWFLLACGVLRLCILDQRYRCRVCLRRLRMPIETGSWSRMLQFGRPYMEYICPFGHGKLNVAELQILGLENPAWTEHADMWEELCGAGKDSEPPR